MRAARPELLPPSGEGPPPSPWLASGLGRAVLRNVAAQGGGRLLVALGRLVVAGLIVRGSGGTTFGEYSLVLGILSVAEWMVDFGGTETFVREVCQAPDQRQRLLRVVSASKVIQVPAAFALLAATLVALRYPGPIVEAALLGGLGFVFYGGVLVYRVAFKATLAMDREMAAELLSAASMIPLVVWAQAEGGGLAALVLCYVASRAVFCGASFLLGRHLFRPSVAGVGREEVVAGLRTAAPIGFIGLLVGAYEVLDVLLLSKFSFTGVAYYAGAQRLVWPTRMALASVGATLYPILATQRRRNPSEFGPALQRGLDGVMALSGAVACGFLAGSGFFMGLLGPDLRPGKDVLEVLAVAGVVRALCSTLGPALYVVHGQGVVLRFMAVAAVAKALFAMLAAPNYGYLGVALVALAVDVVFVAWPTLRAIERLGGYRPRWGAAARVTVAVAVGALAPRALGWEGPSAVALALLTYAALAAASGALRLADLRAVLARRDP